MSISTSTGWRMARVRAAWLVAGLLVSLFAAAAPVAAERVTRTIAVGGLDRSYIAHIPPDASARGPMPVIMVFHPYGVAGRAQEYLSRLHAAPGAEDFVVVYPDGIGDSWNAGRCCGEARARGVDDLGFVRAVLDDLERFAEIAPAGHFATGYSNGAAMSYEVACDMADRFAAVAGVSGQHDPTAGCAAGAPVAVLHIHGTADAFSPFHGGESIVERVGPPPAGVPNLIDFWVAHNGCSGERRTERLDGVACTRHTDCAERAPVVLCAIAGMGHVWPGHRPRGLRGRALGTARPDLPGSADIIRFFDEVRSRPQ